MVRYFFIYIIFIIFFHVCNYLIWKKARGEKQVAAYLHFGSSYFFLFLFFCILPNKSVSSLFKIYYTIGLTIGYGVKFLSFRYFIKSCRTFQRELHQDSKIIIRAMFGMRSPWNFWYRFLDVFLIFSNEFFLKSSIVTWQENYLSTSEIIAYAFRQDIEACSTYLLVTPLGKKLIPDGKSAFWKQDIELYLIPKNSTPQRNELHFPVDRIRFLYPDDIVYPSSILLHLIQVIEDGGMRELVTKKLSMYTDYQGTDPGKCCLAIQIELLLQKHHSITEYFYELMKLAEFMIHYQSLADYEISGSHYFDDGKPVAMGTFQSSIKDIDSFEPKERETYIKAVKYLNHICTGKEGNVNRKKLLAEGRRKLVMIRNHFIGHGSLSYGISVEFVQNLLTVISGQMDNFFHRSEPVIQHSLIYDVPKFQEQEDRLYLLIQLENNFAAYYLDYISGKYFIKRLQENPHETI